MASAEDDSATAEVEAALLEFLTSEVGKAALRVAVHGIHGTDGGCGGEKPPPLPSRQELCEKLWAKLSNLEAEFDEFDEIALVELIRERLCVSLEATFSGQALREELNRSTESVVHALQSSSSVSFLELAGMLQVSVQSIAEWLHVSKHLSPEKSDPQSIPAVQRDVQDAGDSDDLEELHSEGDVGIYSLSSQEVETAVLEMVMTECKDERGLRFQQLYEDNDIESVLMHEASSELLGGLVQLSTSFHDSPTTLRCLRTYLRMIKASPNAGYACQIVSSFAKHMRRFWSIFLAQSVDSRCEHHDTALPEVVVVAHLRTWLAILDELRRCARADVSEDVVEILQSLFGEFVVHQSLSRESRSDVTTSDVPNMLHMRKLIAICRHDNTSVWLSSWLRNVHRRPKLLAALRNCGLVSALQVELQTLRVVHYGCMDIDALAATWSIAAALFESITVCEDLLGRVDLESPTLVTLYIFQLDDVFQTVCSELSVCSSLSTGRANGIVPSGQPLLIGTVMSLMLMSMLAKDGAPLLPPQLVDSVYAAVVQWSEQRSARAITFRRRLASVACAMVSWIGQRSPALEEAQHGMAQLPTSGDWVPVFATVDGVVRMMELCSRVLANTVDVLVAPVSALSTEPLSPDGSVLAHGSKWFVVDAVATYIQSLRNRAIGANAFMSTQLRDPEKLLSAAGGELICQSYQWRALMSFVPFLETAGSHFAVSKLLGSHDVDHFFNKLVGVAVGNSPLGDTPRWADDILYLSMCTSACSPLVGSLLKNGAIRRTLKFSSDRLTGGGITGAKWRERVLQSGLVHIACHSAEGCEAFVRSLAQSLAEPDSSALLHSIVVPNTALDDDDASLEGDEPLPMSDENTIAVVLMSVSSSPVFTVVVSAAQCSWLKQLHNMRWQYKHLQVAPNSFVHLASVACSSLSCRALVLSRWKALETLEYVGEKLASKVTGPIAPQEGQLVHFEWFDREAALFFWMWFSLHRAIAGSVAHCASGPGCKRLQAGVALLRSAAQSGDEFCEALMLAMGKTSHDAEPQRSRSTNSLAKLFQYALPTLAGLSSVVKWMNTGCNVHDSLTFLRSVILGVNNTSKDVHASSSQFVMSGVFSRTNSKSSSRGEDPQRYMFLSDSTSAVLGVVKTHWAALRSRYVGSGPRRSPRTEDLQKSLDALFTRANILSSSPKQEVEPDWFAIVISILFGDVEAENMLITLAQHRSLSRLWYRLNPTVALCICAEVEEIVDIEFPAIKEQFIRHGLPLDVLLLKWIAECFMGVLPVDEILNIMVTVAAFGPGSLSVTVALLLHFLHPQLIDASNRGQFAFYVLNGRADTFRLAEHKDMFRKLLGLYTESNS